MGPARSSAAEPHDLALVLAEHSDPALVAEIFSALGWVARMLPSPTLQPADDRLLGAWDGPGGASAELVDDGWIRVLNAHHLSALVVEALQRLPWRSVDEVLAQLGSLDVRVLLSAIRAAAVLRASDLVIGLVSLRHHRDELVRTEAIAALQTMIPDLAEQGLDLLRETQARTGTSMAWSSAMPLWERRQMIRWLVREGSNREGLTAVLRKALDDPDWEVQAGSVIAAVRHGLGGLATVIRRWEPMQSGHGCPIPVDRASLRALRDVAVVELTDPRLMTKGDTLMRSSVAWTQLARCLHGDAHAVRDHTWLLVRSLSEPLEAFPDQPASRAGWCFIPAVPHWLGDEHRDASPIRQVTGPGGWLQQEPLRTDTGWWMGTWSEAQARAQGDGVVIPDADAWECAARGGDGRCFPWGAGFTDAEDLSSPWGCRGYAQGWEWVMGAAGPELRGGAKAVPCWLRRRPEPGERARLRLCRPA